MRRLRGLRAPRPSPVVVVAIVAFVNCAAWALITPNFQAPDEPTHAAYAVELAETGHPPSNTSTHGYASDELSAFADGLGTFGMNQIAPSTRPPWSRARERQYQKTLTVLKPRRDNGGGPSSAAVHGPVYYAFPALAYRIFYNASFASRMLAMRIASALLAALTVALIYLTVRELAPGHRWAAAVAALLAAFQPMFGFLGGTINTDVGVNLAGAILVYLLVRALRRGLTLPVAIGIPAAFILGSLAKATMLAFVPVLAFGLLAILWRRRWRIRDWLAMIATGLVLAGIWAVVAPSWHHSFIPVPGGGGGVANATPGFGAKLSYVWQIFFPPLPFMHHDFAPGVHPIWDVYVVRAWGSFGWLDVNLPHVMFVAIAIAVCMVIVLILRAAWLERTLLRTRVPETLVLLGSVICVLGFTHAAFARFNPAAAIEEQGRYAFPALTTFAVAGVLACFGLGRRRAAAAGVTMVTTMMLLSGFAQLYVFSSYFT